MTILTHLIHSVAEGTTITGLLYAGTVSIVALTAIAAPTAERRRDARAALGVIMRAQRPD
jgi:hypothetical protein